MSDSTKSTVRLLITCPDRPGIVAAVSGFLHSHGVNIIHSDQHSTDPEGGHFFMRNEFYLPGMDMDGLEDLREQFQADVAGNFDMDWTMNPVWRKKKVAILVSKVDHALMELLWRWRTGSLEADITMVISNHPDLRKSVEFFGVPFHHVPVGRSLREKVAAEDAILAHLDGQADVVVLARYMQILTGDFVTRYPNRIINIHHSFLPAFIGADPYRRAHERGVKLIGATAHYVTEDLDQGPIIEQDVNRVTHSHTVEDLKRLGADIERHVLARAVQWHVQDRVIVDGNKTIVFRR
ncbi:formyltetrahydrofolate deformylase [Pseudodesulfovibrio tunisiensis]|uniref:formyltetrahydrofolate deformylase n=1 Tax=Pseudodesulfovibrio tunisiensis TaxID=463192 RepID=UPI001FB3C657|nr:formyltetrahydrofolate deformylase [Pseudodesulfovibrio tunisiensis]